MKYILSGAQMKYLDHYTIDTLGVPGVVLMERAALSVVETIFDEDYDLSHVVVVCGSGNNGGDGFAIARVLAEHNIRVTAYFAGKKDSLTEAAKRQWKIALRYSVPVIYGRKEPKKDAPAVSEDEIYDIRQLHPTMIIDAMFGIGLNRELSEPYQRMIRQMNICKDSGVSIVSVDVPSGVSADTGQVMGEAVMADMTVTFAYPKQGLILYPGADHAGEVIVCDIGVNDFALDAYLNVRRKKKEDRDRLCSVLTDDDIAGLKRPKHSNKGTFGKVLLICGSRNMGGAALLSASGAFRSGAGMLQVFTHEKNRSLILDSIPEAIVTTYSDYEMKSYFADEEVKSQVDAKLNQAMKWADVIGIGPGITTTDFALELTEASIYRTMKPVVCDADALNLFAEYPKILKDAVARGKEIIITPHVGEFVRLSKVPKERVTEDIVEEAHKYAKEMKLTLLLKDSRSVTADAYENIRINVSGNSGMATAGSGDVLFGIVTGLLAQGLSAFDAASYGAYIHGRCGDMAASAMGEHGMLAGDMIDYMPELLS